ncbi:MAG: hypothetical protein HQ495_07605 [Alphaproteobacteria bacterium]|nr:hypothetical protein [Alphaproteobacteria bacterium]
MVRIVAFAGVLVALGSAAVPWNTALVVAGLAGLFLVPGILWRLCWRRVGLVAIVATFAFLGFSTAVITVATQIDPTFAVVRHGTWVDPALVEGLICHSASDVHVPRGPNDVCFATESDIAATVVVYATLFALPFLGMAFLVGAGVGVLRRWLGVSRRVTT